LDLYEVQLNLMFSQRWRLDWRS